VNTVITFLKTECSSLPIITSLFDGAPSKDLRQS